MTTSVIQPVRMPKRQARAAGEVLARAFHTNPAFVWAVPDDAARPPKLRWFMQTDAKIGDLFGEVYTTPDAVDGVAIWLSPGRTTLSIPQLLRSGFFAAPLHWGIGPFMKFVTVMSRFEELHREAMPGDHWYLSVLGVDPPRQQQGLGSALIQPVLRKADDAGLPCYLETDKPEDIAFYRKHGFEVLVQDLIPKGGPPFWTMRRLARKGP